MTVAELAAELERRGARLRIQAIVLGRGSHQPTRAWSADVQSSSCGARAVELDAESAVVEALRLFDRQLDKERS